MLRAFHRVHRVVAFAAAHLSEKLTLESLAREAGISQFHLHRMLAATTGETPKQLTLRLRLGRAAAMLLASKGSVLNIALECGFQSPEVFCRAFRRRYGMTPREYRRCRAQQGGRTERRIALETQIAACLKFYRMEERRTPLGDEMTYTITKKTIAAQPALAVKRKVKPSEIAQNLGEMFGLVHLTAQKLGAALAGPPFARYLDCPPGLWTIEAGMPLAAPVAGPEGAEVIAITLPAGSAAVALHTGPYDKLSEAHAAIQQWIEKQGLSSAGAPWESYLTDPAEHPDPKDWKTEVVFPLKP